MFSLPTCFAKQFRRYGLMESFNQSPFDQTFVQNPYPAYEIARKLGDVVWWEDYEMPAAVSHRAVRMILSNRNLGTEHPVQHSAQYI